MTCYRPLYNFRNTLHGSERKREHYQHIGYRIKDFYRTGSHAIRADMNNQIAAQRPCLRAACRQVSVLRFWDKHGLTRP